MKWVVVIASAIFWLVMGAIWSFAGWAPQTASAIAAAAEGSIFTAAQIAEHAGTQSCWVIIKGRIYDVTEYVDIHPADPDTILKYCGKDATKGWETKDRKRARPHSPEAERQLEDYFIGTVAGG